MFRPRRRTFQSHANLLPFSFEPEVCDVDARVKPYASVPVGIVDELIQQFTHPGSATDVHVAGKIKGSLFMT